MENKQEVETCCFVQTVSTVPDLTIRLGFSRR
jgi:hypothetical protein